MTKNSKKAKRLIIKSSDEPEQVQDPTFSPENDLKNNYETDQ